MGRIIKVIKVAFHLSFNFYLENSLKFKVTLHFAIWEVLTQLIFCPEKKGTSHFYWYLEPLQLLHSLGMMNSSNCDNIISKSSSNCDNIISNINSWRHLARSHYNKFFLTEGHRGNSGVKSCSMQWRQYKFEKSFRKL